MPEVTMPAFVDILDADGSVLTRVPFFPPNPFMDTDEYVPLCVPADLLRLVRGMRAYDFRGRPMTAAQLNAALSVATTPALSTAVH